MNTHQTVFISYGGPDEAFATRLVAALESRGVKTWFFPRDKVPGQPLDEAMRDGVNTYDRVLAICSESAFKRTGFMNELRHAFRREARQHGASILIPVTIDDFLFSGATTMEGGHYQEILDRTVGDFRKDLADDARFDAEVESVMRGLQKAATISVSAEGGESLSVDATTPSANNAPITTQIVPNPAPPPLLIEFEAGADGYYMQWDKQKGVVKGNEFHYTHRVFRVAVRNTSQTTVRGVQVVLLNVAGIESRHPSVLPGHRLRVMDPNVKDPNRNFGEVNIHPGSSMFFDVAAHDLEPDIHAINDLKFRYADTEKESLPTDPGTWWDFTLQARGIDISPTEGHFRLLVDPANVAQLSKIAPPETLGIEPSFERRKPFDDDDYVDTEYGSGGRVFRIGLRSRERDKSFVASVEIESMDGGIEGGFLERRLRFKDTGLGENTVAYDHRACTFVDVLKYPMMGQGKPTLLYAVKPPYGDDVRLKKAFSLRLRINGGPRSVYMRLYFIPNILGFPEVQSYEVEPLPS